MPSRKTLLKSLCTALVLSLPTAASGASETRVDVGSSLAGNYLAARYAQNLHDMPAALAYLDAVLAVDPDNLTLQRRAFILLLSEGRLPEALPIAARLAESDQRAPIALLALPIDAVARGDYQHALDRLDDLPESGVNTLVSPLVKAWALAGLKRYDQAVAALSALGERNGADPLHLMHLGLIHGLAGNTDDSIEAYRAAGEAQGGLSLRLVLLLANQLIRDGQIEAARKTYRTFARETANPQLIEPAMAQLNARGKPPLLVSEPAQGLAEGLFGIADSMRQQNAHESAVLFGRLVLHLRPGFPEALLMMGALMEDDGHRAHANGFYDQIPKASPLSWTVRLRIADNLDVLDQTDAALDLLDDMADERPDDAAPLIDRGDVLRRHDRHKEAIRAYTKALKRIGEPQPLDWTVFYSRGISYEQSDQWSKAEADFLKALDLQPEQPLVLNYLGYSWMEKGLNLERALDMVKTAVNLRPGDGYIVDSLGWGLYQLGRYEESVREMERAVLLRPHDPVINDHLGDAYWRAGRLREARYQWKRAISFDPDDELLEILEDKLENGLPRPE